MKKTVTTYYLEMTSPAVLPPKRARPDDLEIVRAKIPSPEFGRFLFTTAGREWYWLERLEWTYQEWLDHLAGPGVQTWVAYLAGTPAGYSEFVRRDSGDVHITYFGLFPEFIGQGLGGHLLTDVLERAWEMDPSRVWVHTCTLDHAAALPNYKARGLTLYKEESWERELPESLPGPWPVG